MTNYCAPCLADLALVREAVTTVSGTAACVAHAVLLTHTGDNAQRRLTRLSDLRAMAEEKLPTASDEDRPKIELLIQEYALAGAMDMTVPLKELAGDRAPRPPKNRGGRDRDRNRGDRPGGQGQGQGQGQGGERGPRGDRQGGQAQGGGGDRGPRPDAPAPADAPELSAAESAPAPSQPDNSASSAPTPESSAPESAPAPSQPDNSASPSETPAPEIPAASADVVTPAAEPSGRNEDSGE